MREIIFKFKNGSVLCNIPKWKYKQCYYKNITALKVPDLGFFKVEKDVLYNKNISVYRVLNLIHTYTRSPEEAPYYMIQSSMFLKDSDTPDIIIKRNDLDNKPTIYYREIRSRNFKPDGDSVSIDIDSAPICAIDISPLCVDSGIIRYMLNEVNLPVPTFNFKKIRGNHIFPLSNVENYIESYFNSKSKIREFIALGYADYAFWACKYSKQVREGRINGWLECVNNTKYSDIPDFLLNLHDELQDISPLFSLIDDEVDYAKFLKKFQVERPHFYCTMMFNGCVQIIINELGYSRRDAVNFVLESEHDFSFWSSLSTYYKYVDENSFLKGDWLRRALDNGFNDEYLNSFIYYSFLYFDPPEYYGLSSDSSFISGIPVVYLLGLKENSYTSFYCYDNRNQPLSVFYDFIHDVGFISYRGKFGGEMLLFEEMNLQTLTKSGFSNFSIYNYLTYNEIEKINNKMKDDYNKYIVSKIE